ncbi:MAG: patatin-like phospholipase family protein [Caulobacteraceae bacterium]
MSHVAPVEDLDRRPDEVDAAADPGADPPDLGQKVLVLQGGGALGAYQVGVYQALAEGGMTPDWVIGTSIGAINAAIIAGNRPEDRLSRLAAFWARVEHGGWAHAAVGAGLLGQGWADSLVMAAGIPGFFEPHLQAMFGPHANLGAEHAGLYRTEPLRRTLTELIDFDRLNAGPMRLTVGAANLRTAEMRYFDSRYEALTPTHILASCALPPAFPAVRIDGDLYWDGGIVSNTPVEAVFDDNPRRSGLVFCVHLWNPDGPEPDSLAKVIAREKDVRYFSRAASHIARQKQLHRLRHVITELVGHLPEDVRDRAEVRKLAAYGCTTRMHVIRLLAPQLRGETSTKDIDFSPQGVRARWRAGHADTLRALGKAPWTRPHDDLEGFILHEIEAGEPIQTS